MYDINKYRSARAAGASPTLALRYARGERALTEGIHCKIWVSQRAAVRYTRILARLGRYTFHMSGRSRWKLASHGVRHADWDAREKMYARQAQYPEPDYEPEPRAFRHGHELQFFYTTADR